MINNIKCMCPETNDYDEQEVKRWFLNESLSILLEFYNQDMQEIWDPQAIRDYCYRQMNWASIKILSIKKELPNYLKQFQTYLDSQSLPESQELFHSMIIIIVGSTARFETEIYGDVDLDIIVNVQNPHVYSRVVNEGFKEPFQKCLEGLDLPEHAKIGHPKTDWGFYSYSQLSSISEHDERKKCLTNYFSGCYVLKNKNVFNQEILCDISSEEDMDSFLLELVNKAGQFIPRVHRFEESWHSLKYIYKILSRQLLRLAIKYLNKDHWVFCYFRLVEMLYIELSNKDKITQRDWDIIQTAVLDVIDYRGSVDKKRDDIRTTTIIANIKKFNDVVDRLLL